jgi:1,4-dihydroxy-2-naphthoate octaprenyltransferase
VRLLGAHLRLKFQLLLAPIFMLGALLAGAGPTFELLLAFLAVHAGIYGGMTAFNSYYDQDRGPIAFMKHPVPARRFVRDAAVAIQIVAVAVLAALRPAVALPAIVLVAMGVAYSHPRWRWKAHVGASLFAVSVGQGGLAFAIGYLAGGGATAGLLAPPVAPAALGSALITLGLYPVTQVYQIDEDRARGDRTLAIAIGWRATLLVSALLLAAGVGLLLVALAGRIAPFWSRMLPAGVLGLWLLLGLWARRFEALDTYRNHDWAIGISVLAASAFWILLVSEWVRDAR